MSQEEKIKATEKEATELRTYFTEGNPSGPSTSGAVNPSESKVIAETTFGPSGNDQPEEENICMPGSGSHVKEKLYSGTQRDSSSRRSERFKTLKQNVMRQLREVIGQVEHEHQSVTEENIVQAAPIDDEQRDSSGGHSNIISLDPTRNEEIINLVNEPPTEENRNNIRNLIERSTDSMRNCLAFIQDNLKRIIILLAILGGLALGIILLVNIIAFTQHNVIPDIVTPPQIEPPSISPEYEKYRLPRSVKPIHYNLKILPILSEQDDKDTFRGEVLIHLEILETCRNITLHLHHLTIESIWLGNNEANLENILSYDILMDEQFLIIYPNKKLIKTEKLLLKITFNAYFNKKPVGLYRSSYNYDGEMKSAVMTQMESIHARAVFPCFDEPGLQATFQITIGHKKPMTALSNMPGNVTSNIFLDAKDDYVFTEFQKTPVMSTYLVAFAVVDYKVVKEHDIEIYSERSENETNMLNVVQTSRKMFKVFNKLLDYKYKHPKTTLVTSKDLQNRGMEHWGLITLRTDVVYPDNDATIYKQEYKNVLIAHEIAHQWFGNLITPEWWSHLWLTEGYSTYMSYVIVDKLYPQDDTFIEFNKLKQDALSKDSMSNTREISKELHAPHDIENNIHFLIYRKAASIIMMLDNVLTTERHISGLTRLLQEKSYQTINPNDLYKYLAVHSNTDLTFLQSFMNSWINQIGFPLVTVSRDPDNLVMVKQEKFYSISLANLTTNSDDPLWYIPLTYVIEGDQPEEKSEVFWMNQTRSVKLHNLQKRLKKTDWIIFNSDQIGFYRVNYENNEWRKIITYLREEDGYHNIAPINRAQLIDDSLALAKAGYIDYTIPFDLLRYLEYENDYFPWTRAISSLKYVDGMLMKLKDYHKFKIFMQSLVSNIFKNISTIEPQSSRDIKLQAEIYEWACRADLADCLHHSKSYMDLWMKSKETSNSKNETNPIRINLRSSVYCSAVRHSSDSVWYFLWDEFQHENSVNEIDKILYGLSCTRSVFLLRDYVLSASRSELIDRKNFHKILSYVSQHALGLDTVIYLFSNTMDRLLQKSGRVENLLKYSQITSKCNTEADVVMIEEITSYYYTNPANLDPLINEVNNNILWLKNNHRNIVNWLDDEYKDSRTI